MKNILDDAARAVILSRLDDLTPETERRWGTLTAPEMVCHLRDFVSVALGERDAPVRGNRVMQMALVAKVLLYLMPWGKAKIETPKEIDPKREGRRPGDFSDDESEVRRLVARFVSIPEEEVAPHPVFGDISKRDWGRAIWRNFDHHLEQFGL